MFVFLVVAVTTALWLAEARSIQMRVSRYVLATIGCLFLLPSHIPWTRLPAAPFFEPDEITKVLPAGDQRSSSLPFGEADAGMIWQVKSGMYLTQTGGYFGLPPVWVKYIPDSFTCQIIPASAPPNGKMISVLAGWEHLGDFVRLEERCRWQAGPPLLAW